MVFVGLLHGWHISQPSGHRSTRSMDPADILTDPGLEFTSWRGSCRRVCPPSQRNFDPLDSSCTSEIEMIDYKRQK